MTIGYQLSGRGHEKKSINHPGEHIGVIKIKFKVFNF